MMKKTLLALAATATLGVAAPAGAQLAPDTGGDDMRAVIAQIQGDKRTVVLQNMELTGPEVLAFTKIYDEYQAEMKKLFQRSGELINLYASNYDSMTENAAKDILKESLDLREERTELLTKYAKRMSGKIPEVKVLRWVQIENKLTALLDWQAAQVVPLAK